MEIKSNVEKLEKEIPNIINDIKESFKKYYHVNDLDLLDIVYATAYSHILPDDPLWLTIIAQSSGIKTEIIRSFGDSINEYILPISILTENSIASGSDLEKEPPLAKKMDGKICTIKDLTTLLSDRSEKINKVSSHLRELYDGYIHVASGMKGGSKEIKVKTTIIMGVTPYIDSVRIFKSELGERVLYLRLPEVNEKDIDSIAAIILNKDTSTIKKDEKRNEIYEKVNKLLSLIFKNKNIYKNDIFIDNDDMEHFIKNLSVFIAEMRNSVQWDFTQHNITNVGVKESPARLLIQLKKLSYSLKVVRGVDINDDSIKKSIAKVIMDSIPQQRLLCIKAIISKLQKNSDLINSNVYNTDILEFIKKYKIPRKTIDRYLNELNEMLIIESSWVDDNPKNSKLWKFNDDFFNTHKNILNYIALNVSI